MIEKINNTWLRRCVLLAVFAPVYVLSIVVEAGRVAWDETRFFAGDFREVWRRR